MPAKVIIKVTKGEDEGKVLEVTGHETLVLGRAEDCGIVLHDPTVSRYHCMMEISPPQAAFHDFGCLNGIYLNGKKVVEGRKKDVSPEEARKEKPVIFPLKDGDCIGLSRNCELSVTIIEPEYCADCLVEELESAGEKQYKNDLGRDICEKCFKKLQEKKKRVSDTTQIDKAAPGDTPTVADAAEPEGDKNTCIACGAALDNNNQGEARICGKCRQNNMELLEKLLKKAAGSDREAAAVKEYRRVRKLGEGGMGEAWLVEEVSTGEKAALKSMLPGMALNNKVRQLFMREASIGRFMNHKNVIRQLYFGNAGDMFYILQEYCRGGSVDHLIEKIDEGKLPQVLAVDIILQILEGLDYAHHVKVEAKSADGTMKIQDGIVHRDIKPPNFFIANEFNPDKYFDRDRRSEKLIFRSFRMDQYKADKESQPSMRVADFGLAKAFADGGSISLTGDVKGTLVFMPRQQLKESKYAQPDVDVWAAAASLYNMLTGCIPKDFRSPRSMFQDFLTNPAVPIRSRDSSIDKKLAAVIDAALVDKPNIGIRTALELKKAIEEAF